MEHEHILQLSRKDVMRLVDALDAPLKKHSRLQQAAQRHDNKTQL